ncbi:hypothetical protein GBA52_016819 [Prunus armeniaca]|nr:hypothetical protein GBA52_016819 [Prunus armeniaca]
MLGSLVSTTSPRSPNIQNPLNAEPKPTKQAFDGAIVPNSFGNKRISWLMFLLAKAQEDRSIH